MLVACGNVLVLVPMTFTIMSQSNITLQYNTIVKLKYDIKILVVMNIHCNFSAMKIGKSFKIIKINFLSSFFCMVQKYLLLPACWSHVRLQAKIHENASAPQIHVLPDLRLRG